MGWQNQSGGGNGDKKNPWGKPPQNNGGGPRSPWGSSGGGGRGPSGGGEPPPDIDEMLRRAQKNFQQVMPKSFGGGRMFLLGLLIILGLWAASGLHIIEPGVHGVVQRFGAWDRTHDTEGLHYRMPWPIESVTRVNVSELRRMTVGFAEITGRTGGAQRQSIPEESLMLTADANIVDLNMVVLWNIKSAEDYVFNILDPENTIKKVAESAIREVVGQTGMFPVITRARDQVAQRAREIMIANLDGYTSGVNISQVLIQAAEVHPDVQDAFQDVQSANQDAEDIKNRARAYREDILPRARGAAIRVTQEAEGYKQSVIARANGDARRFNSIYASYTTAEDVTKQRLYLETMENVLQSAQKIILDEGAGGSGVIPYLPLDELRPAAGRGNENNGASRN